MNDNQNIVTVNAKRKKNTHAFSVYVFINIFGISFSFFVFQTAL